MVAGGKMDFDEPRLQKIFSRADAAISEGKLWRAKDILSGNMAHTPYNHLMYEKYGEILLKMGDLPEAGRFLFLSGVRKQEYDSAIEVFLARHQKKPLWNLYHAFPTRARLDVISKYPLAVQSTLRNVGFSELLVKADNGHPNRLNLKEKSISFVVLAIIVFIAACILVGFVVIVKFITNVIW